MFGDRDKKEKTNHIGGHELSCKSIKGKQANHERDAKVVSRADRNLSSKTCDSERQEEAIKSI